MFKSQLSHLTFVEMNHGIISMVIVTLPLIQEGQLSITVESTLYVHKHCLSA